MRLLTLGTLLAALGCTAPVETRTPTDAGHNIDACPSRCDPGMELCGCECVLLQSDEDHCGGCGQACAEANDPRGWTCNAGECSCLLPSQGAATLCSGSPTESCCYQQAGGTACVDLTTDSEHCGSCTNSCVDSTPGANQRADHCENSQCICGGTGQTCAGSLESACCSDKGGANARCADLLQDEADCGACGRTCPTPGRVDGPEGDRCRTGQCVCGTGTPKVSAVPCADDPDAEGPLKGEECCGTGDTAVCVEAGTCGL